MVRHGCSGTAVRVGLGAGARVLCAVCVVAGDRVATAVLVLDAVGTLVAGAAVADRAAVRVPTGD